MTNETQTDRLAEVLQGDPETTQAWADRCLERMQQTPDGPKRKRLAQQHVDLSNRVHFERGYLAATQSLSTDLDNLHKEVSVLRGLQAVPIVDQHGSTVGVEYLSFAELHRHEVYVDEDGVTWVRPTASAYMQARKAMQAKSADLANAEARVKEYRELLALAADVIRSYSRNPDEAIAARIATALKEGMNP